MKRLFSIVFFLALFSGVKASMTIEIVSTPQLTPLLDDIFLAGTMNEWAEGSEDFKLTQQDNGHWAISIEGTQNETIIFKFTRGAWAKVEGNNLGAYIPDRTATYADGTTLQLTIEGWEDIAGNHTVTENVRILDTDFYIPQLDRTRRIWILLPENYDQSDSHYAVLYMHDGQNLFDVATSFTGEWEVDESMTEGYLGWCAQSIVVGIDNGSQYRIDEYAPWVNAEYNEGGEGAQYCDFIAETLKPFIDQNFRTMPAREFTGTAGSSLGALISMYLLTAHNNVFGMGAMFSPAFWFNETELFDYVENNPLDPNTRVYIIGGDSESESMVPLMQQMNDLVDPMIEPGILHFTIWEGGQHNEWYWAQEFGLILDCVTSVEEFKVGPPISVFPNPAMDSINIQLKNGLIQSVEIRSMEGKLVIKKTVNAKSSSIDIHSLPKGNYLVHAIVSDPSITGATLSTAAFIKQ